MVIDRLRAGVARVRCWWGGLGRVVRVRAGLVAAMSAAVVVTLVVSATGFTSNAVSTTGGGGVFADDFGAPQHEDEKTYTYPKPLEFGALRAPPKATPAAHKGVDVVAHWYNDFGLTSTADARYQTNGWFGWYDWRWNFRSNTGDGKTGLGYDPAREPLLGFYQGDDPTVLGWQAYWLAKSGVNVLSLAQSSGFSSQNWQLPSSPSHWAYNLFTKVPNGKAFKYVLWLRSSGKPQSIEAQNDDLVAAYKKYKNAYTYTTGGKRLAVVGIWDMEALRGSYDDYEGQAKTDAYLRNLAAKFKKIGYDGVAVLARNGGLVAAKPGTLAASGVKVFSATYEGLYGKSSAYPTYASYVSKVPFPTSPSSVLGVFTSLNSVRPHPSHYDIRGTSPKLFGQLLAKAVAHIKAHKLPRIVTIYNVSEWAEGGPGLVPNRKDGFGYLEAVRSMPAGRRVRGGGRGRSRGRAPAWARTHASVEPADPSS